MGLSASQARFLQLTARRSDVEFEVQQISFQRLQLSEKMSAASTKYQDAMNNRKLTFSFNTGAGTQEVDISYTNYKNYMNQQLEGLSTTQSKYYLVSSSGNKLVVSSEEERDELIKNNTTRYSVDEIKAAKEKVAEYEAYCEELAAQTTIGEAATDTPQIAQEGDAPLEGSQEVAQEGEAPLEGNQQVAQEGEAPLEPTTIGTAAYVPDKPTEREIKLAAIDLNTSITETINDAKGNPADYVVIEEFTKDDFLIVEDLNDVTTFQNALREGIYYFATYDMNESLDKKQFNIKGIDSLGGGAISDKYDKSDDAAAQAEYEAIQSKVQTLDRKLELRLDQLETERNAIQTEMDSVKKVIEDNIEKSFNTFS